MSAFHSFDYNKANSDTEASGMIGAGGTILKHATIKAMWASKPVYLFDDEATGDFEGAAYRLGWLTDTEDNQGGVIQKRWHLGNFNGTYAAMMWRSDGRGFVFTLTRNRTKPIDGQQSGIGIFTTLDEIVRKLS